MLVGAVRIIEKAMGDGRVRILPSELPILEKLRAHIPAYERADYQIN
jgi:hypothetical protein